MTVAKIQKVSRIMSALCVVGMIGLPVSLSVGWGYPELLGGPYPKSADLWGPANALPPVRSSPLAPHVA